MPRRMRMYPGRVISSGGAYASSNQNATLTYTGGGSAAASNALVDVQAAVNAATAGTTVNVPAGSGTVTWAGTLSITKALRLKGPGRDLLVITDGGTAISIAPDSTTIAAEGAVIVDGFTFDGSSTAASHISITGAGASSSKAFKNLAICNNRFKNSSTTTSGQGVILNVGQTRGVIANNIFDRCNVILKIDGNDSTTEWSNGNFPQSFGTVDNLYFEDNTIGYSSSYSGADPMWTEIGQGGRICIRYNSWNGANCTGQELNDIHGFQNWNPGTGQTGTMVSEVYGNTYTNLTGYRFYNQRGGWGLFHNNSFSGSGGAFEINQYASGDAGGSGCTVDVPGATGVYNTQINNSYFWNNLRNGVEVGVSAGSIGDGCGVTANNGYWNYDAAFTGATGIGRSTASPSGSCAVGVAYWAAPIATPSLNSAVIQQGTLWKCLSTNVWTAYYNPYTYPHPLRV